MTEHEQHDRVRRWVFLPRPAPEIWAAVGGFGAIAEWHPLVESCEEVEIGGDRHRHLRLVDGEYILERLTATGDHFYRTEWVETELPLTDCAAAFSVVAEEGGCHVYWSATFEAGDPIADEMMERILESGLNAISERYG